MSKTITIPLFILSLFSFNYILCLDDDAVKALACIRIIKGLTSQDLDQQVLSAYMLSCYVYIDQQTVEKVISSQYNSNSFKLEKKIYEHLIDFQELQREYSQKELMDYTQSLNSAIGKIQEYQGIGPDGKPTGKSGNRRSNQNIENEAGIIPFVIKQFLELFNPNDSFLFLVGVCFLAYFGLKVLRKFFGNNTKKKNDSNKKKTKSY